MSIVSRIRNCTLVRDTRGANMVEYIILVGLVAFIAIAGFGIFGKDVSAQIEKQGTAVGNINATFAAP